MKKTILTILLSVCCFFQASAIKAISISTLPNGSKYISDQFIITTGINTPTLEFSSDRSNKLNTNISSITNLCREFGVIDIKPFYDGILSNPILIREVSKIYIVTILDNNLLFDAIAAFTNDLNVEHAELYTLPELMYEPNDPFLYDQWYLYHTQVTEAWDSIRGDTTRHFLISIVDTGA